ncbi:MAG: ATP synthase F0 subunit B [Bryobacteraceae bacterium]|nr:ATP synthase F0 subunit B [Bryobacteraceae bacterium]
MNLLRPLLGLLLAALPVLAAGDHGDHGDPFLIKKIFNFAILAAGIGYLFIKVINPLLRGQQREITENLDLARRQAEQAESRAREIEARMDGLEGEIAALREKAAAELKAESERLDREAAAQLAKIEQNSRQEIESAVKFARQDLKAYSAALAVDLARQRIQAALDDPAQGRLVHRFTESLSAPRAGLN